MVPSAYIPVAKIPMTTTNKTDRRALRELGKTKTLEDLARLQSHGKENRPPTTPMEIKLQQLWSSVLGVDASIISTDSSFLRIGGESITAMRLVTAARAQKLSLTVADIFKAPKLSQLAMLVKGADEEESILPVQPFSLLDTDDTNGFLREFVEPLIDEEAGSVQDVLPCTDFQTCAILDALQDPPSRLPHWVFDLPAEVDFSRLESACQKLVAHFDILHTVFVEASNRFWQVLLPSMKIEFDRYDMDKDADIVASTNSLCKQDHQRPRHLGRSLIR